VEETNCRICIKRIAESREHLPPQSTNNRGQVYIRFIRNDTSKGVEHKSVELQNGFWMRVLCQKCNERIGRVYGGNYGDFYKQFAAASLLFDTKDNHQIYLRDIYPLRILKQMFAMFLCIYPSAPPPEWESLRNFVQRKEGLLPADAPRVYLYKNDSTNSRIVLRCALIEIHTDRKPILISEISRAPVGIVFGEVVDDRFDYMEEITHWGRMSYKKKMNLCLSLPAHKITHDHPLAFGTPDEVEQWRTNKGIIWAVPESDYKEMETNTSLILRRRRP
jgi:hypothetical protein